MSDQTDNSMHGDFSMRTIATIRSCYPQRFGIPRQAGLVESARAAIVFEATRDNELAVRDIESFSHLWVVFVFHKQNYSHFKPLVQPPRLGGKKNMGVYATRSPNRPNPIGLSAVLLERVEFSKTEILLHIRAGDFLDGTPVLDIKPYIPFADSLPAATSDWADSAEATLPVEWSGTALEELAIAEPDSAAADDLRQLIDETIALDPRPAHERGSDGRQGQSWGMRFRHIDVKWQVTRGTAQIVTIVVV